MPYKSEKQKKYMHSQKPEIAKKWDEEMHTGDMKKKARKMMAKKMMMK